MMDETGAPFSIYPYSYEDELAKKRATQENEERRRLQLASELSIDIGVVAIAALTGIAGPEYKEMQTQPATEQSRKFGQISVRHLVTIDDRSPLLTPIDVQQNAAITEQAINGYASRQAA